VLEKDLSHVAMPTGMQSATRYSLQKFGYNPFCNCSFTFAFIATLKGELGELQIYFRKILLHQQKFLMVSAFFLIRLVAEKFEKNVQNKTTKLFSVGNTFRQATMHAWIS